MNFFEYIVQDLMKPGAGTSPHHRAVTFIGHALVGATFVGPFGYLDLRPYLAIILSFVLAMFFAVLYWRLKERRDLRNGGQFWDSVEDTLGVALGAFYGFELWPLVVLACALVPYARGFKK